MKRPTFLLLRILISFSLIAYLITKIGRRGLGELPLYLNSANHLHLGIALLLLSTTLLLGVIRWSGLLSVQRIGLNLRATACLYLIGLFFNSFLPTTIGGDAIKVYYLSRLSKRPAESLASVIMDRVVGGFGLLLVVVIVVLICLRMSLGRDVILGVTGMLLFFLLVVLLIFHRGLAKRLLPSKFKEAIEKFHYAIFIYRDRKGTIGRALGLSLLIHIGLIVANFFISSAYHLGIPILYFFLFIPLIAAIMSLPIFFGGLGGRECGFVFFFTKLQGVSEVDAFALALTLYLFTLLSSSVGALIYILKDRFLPVRKGG